MGAVHEVWQCCLWFEQHATLTCPIHLACIWLPIRGMISREF